MLDPAPYSTQYTVLDSTRGNLDTLQGISKTGKDNKELTALRVVLYVVTERVLCNRSTVSISRLE